MIEVTYQMSAVLLPKVVEGGEAISGKVIYQKGMPKVMLRNNKTMELRVRPGSDIRERERVLVSWYRRRLKEEVAPLDENEMGYVQYSGAAHLVE